MLDKLEAIKERFEEVSQLLIQPEAMSDMKRFKTLNKEYKDLDKIVQEYKKYQNLLGNIENAKQVIATEKVNITGDVTAKAFDLNGMAKGVYILKVTSGDNLTFRKVILD